MPTAWWLRPERSAARVGEHSAVVWKRLYFRPDAASRSAVGVAHGPPNALDAPNPTSSSRITNTFGAPAGGRSGVIGGNFVSGSFVVYVVRLTGFKSGIGSTWRGTSVIESTLFSQHTRLSPPYSRRAPRTRSNNYLDAARSLWRGSEQFRCSQNVVKRRWADMRNAPDPSVYKEFRGVSRAVPVGFEPTVDFHPHNFSRVAPSAARTRYREGV